MSSTPLQHRGLVKHNKSAQTVGMGLGGPGLGCAGVADQAQKRAPSASEGSDRTSSLASSESGSCEWVAVRIALSMCGSLRFMSRGVWPSRSVTSYP